VEHSPFEELSTTELFDYQRKLASSPYLTERFRTPWVAVEFRQRLESCTDYEIADLLSLVQGGLGFLSPDFAGRSIRPNCSLDKELSRNVDELNELGVEFYSVREGIDTTTGPMARMFLTMVSSIAELEQSLIAEIIRAGMRRAKLEGQRLGRSPLNMDRESCEIVSTVSA